MIGETSLLMVLVAIGAAVPAMKDVTVTQSGDEITIGNEFLSRTYDISGRKVQTIRIENKRSGRKVEPSSCEEFVIHLKDGSKQNASDFALEAWDVTDGAAGAKTLTLSLTHASKGWNVRLHVEMKPGDWFLRKHLEIKRTTSREVDRIDLESIELAGGLWDFPRIDSRDERKHTPRYVSWNPDLGQPVYAGDLFFGVEFPASDNRIRTRIEAEDMALTNYGTGLVRYVSGGEVIKTNSTGSAAYTFSGNDGTYDLVVGYVDENNGNARMKVRINGDEVDSWNWDENPGDPSKYAFTLRRRTAARGLTLHSGDTIELHGTRDGDESASVDYIEFRPVGDTIGRVVAGYDWGRSIGAKTYITHSSVCGAGIDEEGVGEAFLEYVRTIRAHPARMYVQYNNWWDTGWRVNAESFIASVKSIQKHLAEKGVKPFDGYMIDHGWWTHNPELWDVDTSRFPEGLGDVQSEIESGGSKLGLWLSPSSSYGQGNRLAAKGYEMVDKSRRDRKIACLAGPKIVHDLKEKILWHMREHNVASWKLDGWFDSGSVCSDPAHGHPVGKDGKYYLTASVEAWIGVCQAMRVQNPDVHINITCWTWLSPWFLMHVDNVWMNNATDQGWSGEGTDRNQQLNYRDGRIYHNIETNKIQFPLWGLFHLDPIKQRLGFEPTRRSYQVSETIEEFRNYMYMTFSRGSGLAELYLAPSIMNDKEWQITADVLKWAKKNFEALDRVRIIGGNPAAGEIYGYSGWISGKGVISLRNPSSDAKTFQITLNRSVGVVPGSGPFLRRVILPSESSETSPYSYGDTISVTINPFEVLVWEFTAHHF